MGLFAHLVGDVPGQAGGIFTSSSDLSHLADALDDDHATARHAKDLPEEWEGEAADAFTGVMGDQLDQLRNLEEGVRRSAGALEDYGWVVQTEQGRCHDIRARMVELDRVVDEASLGEKLQAYLRVLPQATQNRQDYVSAVAAVRDAAANCAALLAQGAHAEPYNYNDNGQDVSRRQDLSGYEMEQIAEDLENGTILPSDVNQNGIGDCYLLASLSSMARTPEGREHLAEMVQPQYEDGKLVGFMVTLYEDPLDPESGTGRTVFVDDVYTMGTQGRQPYEPNVFSVIEAAYGQVYPAGTRSENAEGNGLNGGRPERSMDELTGTDAEVIDRRRGIFGFGEGYSDAQREEIGAATQQGRPVVAATVGVPGENFKDGANITTATMMNGKPQQIEIVGAHAYEVVTSDENGVTLRNPWGYNNTGADGTDPLDATFTLTWEDFEKYCGDVAVGGGYPS